MARGLWEERETAEDWESGRLGTKARGEMEERETGKIGRVGDGESENRETGETRESGKRGGYSLPATRYWLLSRPCPLLATRYSPLACSLLTPSS